MACMHVNCLQPSDWFVYGFVTAHKVSAGVPQKNMNPIEFNPQILWQTITWWKVKNPFFFNIVSKLRYDLFILPLCVLSLKIFNLDLYLVLFSASVDSWLTDREGVKSNDGDMRWCVLRSQNVSQSDDCHSVGFLFLTLPHLLVSISLSLPLSLSLPGVKLVLNVSVLSSLSHRVRNWSRARAFWVFRLFKGQWWNRPL